MKNRYLLIILAFLIVSKLDAQIDTIYVDKCGYQATKQDYDYYQVLEQENDLIKVTGYKKSGKKLMVFLENNKKIFGGFFVLQFCQPHFW